MKCFRHPDLDALGICRSCFKGLCGLCVVDVGNGIACKNSCEQSVGLLNSQIAQAKGYATANPAIYAFTASLAMAAGFYVMHSSAMLGSTLIALAAFLLGLSGWLFLRLLQTQTKPIGELNPNQATVHDSDALLENEFKRLEKNLTRENGEKVE